MSNVVRLPTLDAALDASTNRIKLMNGAIVLYQRDSAKGTYHYSLKLPEGLERRSTGTSDLSEATRIATERWQTVKWRVGRGLSVDTPTFAVAAGAYIVELERQQTQPGKHANHGIHIKAIQRYLVPYFGELSLSDIRQSDIDVYHTSYLEHWQDKWRSGQRMRAPSNYSRRQHEGLVLRIVEWAINSGSMNRAERPEIRTTTYSTRTRGAFSGDEVVTLKAYLAHHATLPRNKRFQKLRHLLSLYVEFLLATGMRPGSEPLSIRICDIKDNSLNNHPHVILSVRRGKRGGRQVLVRSDVLPLVRRIIALHPANPSPTTSLFQIEGESRHAARFQTGFNNALKALGMTLDASGAPRSLYSLRHTYITDAIERDVNISWLAKNCGTSVKEVENTYSHILHIRMTSELLK